MLRSMLDLFCDRQTYYKGYEDAMRCMRNARPPARRKR